MSHAWMVRAGDEEAGMTEEGLSYNISIGL